MDECVTEILHAGAFFRFADYLASPTTNHVIVVVDLIAFKDFMEYFTSFCHEQLV